MLSNPPKGVKLNLEQSSRHIRSNAFNKGRSSFSHKMLRPMSSISMSPKERPNFPEKKQQNHQAVDEIPSRSVWWGVETFGSASIVSDFPNKVLISTVDEPVRLTFSNLKKILLKFYILLPYSKNIFTKFPAKVFNSMVSVAEQAVKKRWKIRRSGYNTTGVTANNMAVPASTLTMTWGLKKRFKDFFSVILLIFGISLSFVTRHPFRVGDSKSAKVFLLDFMTSFRGSSFRTWKPIMPNMSISSCCCSEIGNFPQRKTQKKTWTAINSVEFGLGWGQSCLLRVMLTNFIPKQ